jgi:mono/diheme cytochrome c family protein
MRRISPVALFLSLLAILSAALLSCAKQTPAPAPVSEADQVARGHYLVTIIGCADCHTPGYMYGAPDTARALSGSELGWKGPWGVSYPRNLTPEPQSGIAAWSESDIVTAIRTGKRPDGRILLPPMPWPDLAALTDDDAMAIAKYLKSLPPVLHKAPDIVPPGTPVKGSYFALPPPSAWDAPKTPPAAPPAKP